MWFKCGLLNVVNGLGHLNKCGCRGCCLTDNLSYIHGMKLQVTKAQKIDQIGMVERNERDSDTCKLKMQSYIYGAEKKER